MKRAVLAILILSFLVLPARAQEPTDYRLYFPLVNDMPADCNETWRIIVPDGTTNQVLNPSAETTGNFAAVGGAVVTRSTTYSHYGLYSYRLQTGGGEGVSLTTTTLADAAHFVTMRVTGDLPDAWRWTIGGGTRVPQLIEAIDADWDLYGVPFTAAECNGQTALSITQLGAGTGDFYVDGVQVEASTYWTTYCDGTQEGCAWSGSEHVSASQRSAQSRAGGRVRDLWNDYGFFVEEVVGVGAAPVSVGTRSYAILPGGELSGSKVNERSFTLIGRFVGDSEADLHAKRQELIEELGIDTYPEKQAVRVRFSGATVQKQISAYYTGGLEAQLKVSYGPWQVEGDDAWRNLDYWTEKVAVQFLAPDPMWYEIGESAVLLDTNDSATLRYCTGRLRSTGQWDDLGLTNNPTAGGTIYAITISPDGLVYIGGNFTGWNNEANRDYIAAYDPSTDAWSTVGPGASVNDTVRALEFGPDGILYIGGDFTNLGGADGDGFSSYDPSTDTFSDLVASPVGTTVYDLAFGLDGTLYIGGAFTNWGDANGDYIVSWDGAAISSLGTGMDSFVYCLGVGIDGTVYAGGNFTTAGGTSANYIAEWDGSSWSALGSGFDDAARAIATGPDGTIYVCGFFTTAGGGTVNYIAKWNGTSWSALGSGLSSSGYGLDIGDDGLVYVGGIFTAAGGITLADRIAKWNGASWAHLDIDLPGTPTTYAIATRSTDPVITQNYDLFIGFSTTGAGYFAGSTTATNDGTVEAYPVIVFERSGGTSATIYQVRNETTGKVLLFDYDLLDGETLTIDLNPEQKRIISNFFGPRLDAVLANSDFGTWNLQPDDNDATSFVNVAGDPTVTAYLLWKDTYRSLD